MHKVDINLLIALSQRVGQGLLSYYQTSYDIRLKADKTPVTTADKWAHTQIVNALRSAYPDIPVLSEENAKTSSYKTRKLWEYFFLVDPLDGTKEFINQNGEFTVNIALIHQTELMLGVLYAPISDVHYYGMKGQGAYKREKTKTTRLRCEKPGLNPRILVSRSHMCEKTTQHLAFLKKQHAELEVLAVGSALKFGYIAEGRADIYLRYTPTMEWDTAAGHVIVTEAGKQLKPIEPNIIFTYNKPNLINPGFIIE